MQHFDALETRRAAARAAARIHGGAGRILDSEMDRPYRTVTSLDVVAGASEMRRPSIGVPPPRGR